MNNLIGTKGKWRPIHVVQGLCSLIDGFIGFFSLGYLWGGFEMKYIFWITRTDLEKEIKRRSYE